MEAARTLLARAPAVDLEGVVALAHAGAELHGVGDHDAAASDGLAASSVTVTTSFSAGQLSEAETRGRQSQAASEGGSVSLFAAVSSSKKRWVWSSRKVQRAEAARAVCMPASALRLLPVTTYTERGAVSVASAVKVQVARAAASLEHADMLAVKARARASDQTPDSSPAAVGVVDALRPGAIVPLAHRDDLGAGALEGEDNEVDHPLVGVDVLGVRG